MVIHFTMLSPHLVSWLSLSFCFCQKSPATFENKMMGNSEHAWKYTCWLVMVSINMIPRIPTHVVLIGQQSNHGCLAMSCIPLNACVRLHSFLSHFQYQPWWIFRWCVNFFVVIINFFLHLQRWCNPFNNFPKSFNYTIQLPLHHHLATWWHHQVFIKHFLPCNNRKVK